MWFFKRDKTVESAKRHAEEIANEAKEANRRKAKADELSAKIAAVDKEKQKCEELSRRQEGGRSLFWDNRALNFAKKKLHLENELKRLVK
jgi:hypothetical protein